MKMIDLDFVGVLVVVIVGVIVVARLRALPKKGLPYIAVALIPVLGYAIFKKYLMNDQLKELEKKEKALAALDPVIQNDGVKTKDELDKLQGIRAELADMKAAHEKNVLTMNERQRRQDKKMQNLSDAEYLAELKKQHGIQ